MLYRLIVRPANIMIAVIAERYRIIKREKSRDLVDLLVPYFTIAPSMRTKE